MNASQNEPLTKGDFERLSEFRYQLRRFLHISEAILHAEGITPVQYLMLLHIKGMRARQWATIAELAERLQTVHHGVVSLVSRCEAAGFVERHQSLTDRRQVEIHLLAAGEQRLKRVAVRHRRQLRPFNKAWELQFDDRVFVGDQSGEGAADEDFTLPVVRRARKRIAGQRS